VSLQWEFGGDTSFAHFLYIAEDEMATWIDLCLTKGMIRNDNHDFRMTA